MARVRARRLQRRLPAIATSVIGGMFWAVWHLPLFLMPGTYQSELGVNTAAFWSFLLLLVLTSPIIAWLYNGSGRTVFAAVLFHGAGNAVGEIQLPIDRRHSRRGDRRIYL